MENKKTLVIGASPNSGRYSYKAVILLQKFGYIVEALGVKDGIVGNVEIQKGLPLFIDIHTITLYINPQKQAEYYKYIINLNPKRIIFNPGAENAEFRNIAKKAGIEVVEDCTLVMLNGGRF
jgi:uncharacterized protein